MMNFFLLQIYLGVNFFLFVLLFRPDVECCGDKLFPPESQRHHVCCDGIQQSTHDGRTECQGSLPYNPDRETVCGDVRYPVPDATCCGSALFDADVALCCQDNVM